MAPFLRQYFFIVNKMLMIIKRVKYYDDKFPQQDDVS